LEGDRRQKIHPRDLEERRTAFPRPPIRFAPPVAAEVDEVRPQRLEIALDAAPRDADLLLLEQALDCGGADLLRRPRDESQDRPLAKERLAVRPRARHAGNHMRHSPSLATNGAVIFRRDRGVALAIICSQTYLRLSTAYRSETSDGVRRQTGAV